MLSHRQLFLNHLAQTSENPLMLEIERAEGIYLYSPDGKKYMDLISGISVSNLGHSHPAIVNAVKNQAEKFFHLMVYGEFVVHPQVAFAKLLCDHLPENLNTVYFTNSGAEAIEGAMKIAKRFTGRSEIVAFKNAYHGSTQGALSIIGDESLKKNYRPLLPDILQLDFNDHDQLRLITNKSACVIIEPVQAEAGVIVGEKYYLKALRKKCDETKTLLVFDESQTAFGRTGSLFSFQEYEVIPDILVLSKALGAGLPLGAFISSKEILGVIQKNPVLGHITTFGGNALSCTAGLTAVQVLLDSDLISQVKKKEKLFRDHLQHKAIKNSRSAGLLISLQLQNEETNMKVIHQCIENGLVVDWFLFAADCLRIASPLTITEEEIKSACEIILGSLEKFTG